MQIHLTKEFLNPHETAGNHEAHALHLSLAAVAAVAAAVAPVVVAAVAAEPLTTSPDGETLYVDGAAAASLPPAADDAAAAAAAWVPCECPRTFCAGVLLLRLQQNFA